MSEANPVWELQEAVALTRSLHKLLAGVGSWPALGGGVLNRGYSFKDIDLLIMPLNREANVRDTVRVLLQNGFTYLRGASDDNTPGRVTEVFEYDGRRVDVMFLDWGSPASILHGDIWAEWYMLAEDEWSKNRQGSAHIEVP